MSTESIYEYVCSGNNGNNSNCIIYSDIWNYSQRCKLVKNDEDVHNVINEICHWGLPGLFVVDKVIDYGKNIDEQLEKKSHVISTGINSDVMMMDKVKKAIQFATYMHKEQDRKDGTPYIKHPLNVLNNVKYFKKSHKMDVLLSSAALHDTIEDTEATYIDINSQFGEQVASIVMELTTDEDVKDLLGKERYLELKMQHMTSWALVIKLCDRLDNVSDLLNCDERFRHKYVSETVGILEYLFSNGRFTKTHLTIIEQILFKLAKASMEDGEMLLKIKDLTEKYILLKKEFGPELNSESDDRFENILRLQRTILKHLL